MKKKRFIATLGVRGVLCPSKDKKAFIPDKTYEKDNREAPAKVKYE